MSDIRDLLAAAFHESSGPVHRAGIDPGSDSDQCVDDADAILATTSGQSLAARTGALEAALRDLIDEGADGYILDTAAYFRACDLFEPPEDTSQADLLDAVDRGEVPVAVARRRLGLAPQEPGQ